MQFQLLIFSGVLNLVHHLWTLLVFDFPLGTSNTFLCFMLFSTSENAANSACSDLDTIRRQITTISHILFLLSLHVVDQHSVVRISTRYGLDHPGILSRWRQGFPHPSRLVLSSAQPPKKWVKRPGRGVDHLLSYNAEVEKQQTYTSTPPLGLCGMFCGELDL